MSKFHLKTTSLSTAAFQLGTELSSFLLFPPNIFLPVVFVCAILVVNNKHRCLLGSGGEKTKMEPALFSSLSLACLFILLFCLSFVLSKGSKQKQQQQPLKEGGGVGE